MSTIASSAYSLISDEQVRSLAIPDGPDELSRSELQRRSLLLVDVRVAISEYLQTMPGDYCPGCGGRWSLENWRPGDPVNSYPAPGKAKRSRQANGAQAPTGADTE